MLVMSRFVVLICHVFLKLLSDLFWLGTAGVGHPQLSAAMVTH